MKYLVLVLVIFAVYWILKTYRRKAERPGQPGRAVEDMVRCAHCGLHLPRGESVASGEAFFCTPEHRRLHVKVD